jgi:putative membrane protein
VTESSETIRGPAKARATAVIAGAIGLAVATAVIGYFNFGSVLAAIGPIGWGGFLLIIAAQVVVFVPLGLAWQLAGPRGAGSSALFMWGRLMREAASDVLPFSQFGGLVIAGRVAVLGGVSTAVAFGSSVVDITVEIAAQLIYTASGIALLLPRLGGVHSKTLIWSLLAGMVGGGVVVAGMVATQQRGVGFAQQVLHKLAPSLASHAEAVTEVFQDAYAEHLRLFGCLALHLIGWFGGAAGAWLILRFMGHPLPYTSVVAIESILFAIRNAAFIVPSGIGVQEGAYALLGPLFGLPVEAALALSLLKRARDIAVGVPVLLSWQIFEGRRSLRNQAAPVEAEGPRAPP